MMTVRRRKNSIGVQFSWRSIPMMESPAYQILSLAGHRVLARIEIELAHHGGNDNGKLPVTFDHFAEYGIDRHSIAPAMREVCALGFVEITEQGRAGNAEWRRPNQFRLTYRPVGSAKPTDEWKHINTVEEARMKAQGARTRSPNGRKSPVGVSAISQWGNPHRKRRFHGGKSPTTVNGGETPTTSTISGMNRQSMGRDRRGALLPRVVLPPREPAEANLERGAHTRPRRHQGRPPNKLRICARELFATSSPSALSISDMADLLGAKQLDVNAVVQTMVAAGEIVRMERATYAWSVCAYPRQSAEMEAYRRGRRLA
jgi:hypothetical protein